MESIVKKPKTLSIMPTFTCPASCNNCGTYSNPKDRNFINVESIIKSIEQAKELNFSNVVFTGGESTLRWNDLKIGIKYARELGLPTRIVTNAHWAKNEKISNLKIQELIEVGLNEINYSTGDEHVNFIPVENIINATVSSLSLGLRTSIMVELTKSRTISEEMIRELLKKRNIPESQEAFLSIIESPWMPLDPNEVGDYSEDLFANIKNVNSRTGCESVLQTYVVQGDGRVASCCGLGMRKIKELNVSTVNEEDFLKKAIEYSENDVFKLLLHYVGPEKLLSWTAKKDPNIKWENMYAHRCQACIRIYDDELIKNVIKVHHKTLILGLVQSMYLQNELIPENFYRSSKIL
jgi:MoaA/NifB/PqqE/SkfB family radical SAM enzyme